MQGEHVPWRLLSQCSMRVLALIHFQSQQMCVAAVQLVPHTDAGRGAAPRAKRWHLQGKLPRNDISKRYMLARLLIAPD
jgi:hypothetical protein